MLERDYQAGLIKKLKRMFPGCVVLKNDPEYLQGIPDLVIFYGKHWAMLEVKGSERASQRPNQAYYVDMLNEMSFAAFIYPSNEETILDELQRAFASPRRARLSQPE
jgi:hypothetical protein